MPVQQPDRPKRRFLIVSGMLALAAAFTLLLPLLNAPIAGASYAKQVKLELGSWRGIEREIDARTAEILQTDDVVERRYTKANEPWVDLTIVFAKEQRKVAHPQEICLRGAGYNLQDYSRPMVPTGMSNPHDIPVVKLRIELGSNKYLVYYWYKCSGRYTASYYWENLLIMWSQVTLRPANGALVKLTTPIEQDVATSDRRLQSFMALAMPEITEKLP